MKTPEITAKKWFNEGQRVYYNHKENRIFSNHKGQASQNIVQVFQAIVNNQLESANWLTMLPGFPDGSFGWSRVENQLKELKMPRMYLDYMGQGDSDKPEDYNYSTMQRASQVEAHWQAQQIESTFLVTFDYSSLVAMELLNRQIERVQRGETNFTKIHTVLMINGGLFADAHSHPLMTTPLLKTSFGKMGTRMAQKSKFMFNQMLKGLWSKEYGVTKQELSELFDAITRRNGAVFMSNAAGFVDEHQKNAVRWDLKRLFLKLRNDVSFHIVGSEKDKFEPKQITKAKERLGEYGVDIRMVPGGHLTTSEYPEILTEIIMELNAKTWK